MEEAQSSWPHKEEGWLLSMPNNQISNLVLQQLSRVAAERSEELRLRYRSKIGDYDPEQLVFIDKSSVDCWTSYHRCAWSLCGTHAKRKTYFVRGKW